MKGGNFYDKYSTKKPIERWLVKRFLQDFSDLAEKTGALSVHEVGCGEGNLIASLAKANRILLGTDVSADIISNAKERHCHVRPFIQFAVASIEELRTEAESAELMICCEVLEHLPDPERALRVLAKLARPYLLVSVPREPLWRILNIARLKYVGKLGNTPGHLNHWSRRSFIRLLQNYGDICEIRAPTPWIMALCKRFESEAV